MTLVRCSTWNYYERNSLNYCERNLTDRTPRGKKKKSPFNTLNTCTYFFREKISFHEQPPDIKRQIHAHGLHNTMHKKYGSLIGIHFSCFGFPNMLNDNDNDCYFVHYL